MRVASFTERPACKQVLRVVEALPFTADDLYTVTSAQGCFADTLREVAIHRHLEPSAEVSLRRPCGSFKQ